MRIVIADDNPRTRSVIRELLSTEAGWEVCGEAWNGPQTLEKVRELRPDLVLLDVTMPFPDGLETARQIRVEMPDIKILMVSQHEARDLLPSALASGADGCLDKARIGRDLVSTIKSLQDRHAYRRNSS